MRKLFTVGQGLDDLVRDVETRADPNHILNDQVEFFVFRQLLDCFICFLNDRGVFLVLAQIQILSEFALTTLEFTRQVVELLFLTAPLRL